MKTMMNDRIRAYDRAARFYNLMNRLYFFGKDTLFRRLLVQLLVPYRSVLNLCCGTGLDFHPLHDCISEPGRIIGIDISVQMLRHAKRKRLPGVYLVRADITHLPFRREVFQAVLATFYLTIMPTPDSSIAEVRRVLQSRGKIGVLANHQPNTFLLKMLAKLIGAMAHINFDSNLEKLLSTLLMITHKRFLYTEMVQLSRWFGMKKEFSYIA